MADVFEDLSQEDKNLLNYMDSRHASVDDNEVDSDYETRLYSLVHYSEENELEPGDVINSDTLAYVSKGTKVSRLNPVTSIETAYSSSPFDGPTHKPNNKYHINENNLHNLLDSYKKAKSDFSHSTPIRKKTNQKTPVLNSFKQNSDSGILQTETSENDFIRIGDQSISEYFNITPLNESVCRDTISDYSITRKTDRSKFKKLNCVNHLENSAGSSGRHLTLHGGDEGSNIENSPIISKFSPLLRRKKKSNATIIETDEELGSSKYNMKLNSRKTNTRSLKDSEHVASKSEMHLMKNGMKNDISESIIILDDSDSNSSIFEMEAPVKEPPVVVILSSEDEAVGKVEEEKEDIIVLYSGGEKPTTLSSTDNRQFSSDSPVQKKSKNKKKGRKVNVFSDQDISPSSWTKNMSHFYNDSWGGEDFDVKKLQLSMSGKRSNWLVSDLDHAFDGMNGQRIKCQRCNNYGHRARFCTETLKPYVCLFCGIVGHTQAKCPTAVCLHCGKPSMVYKSGCNMCSSNRNNNHPCNICKLTDHHATDCPETWRRYHSTTTEEELSSEVKTQYKPCNEQYCSNCTVRGHQYHECGKSKQQGNCQKRANSSFIEQNNYAKRRKLDKKKVKKKPYPQNTNKSFYNYPDRSYYRPFYYDVYV